MDRRVQQQDPTSPDYGNYECKKGRHYMPDEDFGSFANSNKKITCSHCLQGATKVRSVVAKPQVPAELHVLLSRRAPLASLNSNIIHLSRRTRAETALPPTPEQAREVSAARNAPPVPRYANLPRPSTQERPPARSPSVAPTATPPNSSVSDSNNSLPHFDQSPRGQKRYYRPIVEESSDEEDPAPAHDGAEILLPDFPNTPDPEPASEPDLEQEPVFGPESSSEEEEDDMPTVLQRAAKRGVGRPRKKKKNVGKKRTAHISELELNGAPHYIGPMTDPCPNCSALHFKDEGTRIRKHGNSWWSYGRCCMHGDVELQLPETPREMMLLWTAQTEPAKHFRKHARQYNNAVAFTSFSYDKDSRINHLGPGVKSFAVHGQVYHYQGAMEAEHGEVPAFNQWLTLDPVYAADARASLDWNKDLRRDTVAQLDMLLREVNPYVKVYKHAKEVVKSVRARQAGNQEDWRVVLSPQLKLIFEKRGEHEGRHNLPTVPEVSLFLPDEIDDGRMGGSRDIILAQRSFDASGNVSAAFFKVFPC